MRKALIVVGLGLALVGCQLKPTPTPIPTPDALGIYLILVDDYTSLNTIVQMRDRAPDEIQRMEMAMQAIVPPPDLRQLHLQALEAFNYIYEGLSLLPAPGDNVLVAEANFMVDWGISRLMEYRELLDAYAQEHGRQ
ncbi:MAG: hypothetical protein H5T64_09485 [Chloroflexi bacterium]|nr:hypothetical protein [Chloroflexota bacterium]